MYEGDLMNYAALQGNVEILRWLMEEKGWDMNWKLGERAAMGGSVEVLKYLRNHPQKSYHPFEETPFACEGAARGGRLEALKFLRAHGPPCPWSADTCSFAAQGGHLDVLKWLILLRHREGTWTF